MYMHPQPKTTDEVVRLRQAAGKYLKSLREAAGLSQRGMADKMGFPYYTFISQVESGRGRVPPERYVEWAGILKVPPREFVRSLMRYYDPVTYDILFGVTEVTTPEAREVDSHAEANEQQAEEKARDEEKTRDLEARLAALEALMANSR